MKKSLGQHFLYNTDILKKIVEAAEVKAEDTVIEVGPGTGTLTDQLIATGARIIAVEKDRDLVVKLKEKYREAKNIEIVHEDILNFGALRFTLSALRYKLIGNIPYYLTSHLIRTVLQSWPLPKCIVFMVQREVAQRMTARPPHMNLLAVLVQSYGTVKIVRTVKRGSFVPPPKVDSAIIKLVPRSEQWVVGSETQLRTNHYPLLELATQGFRNPRKMLGNNIAKELLKKAGIDPHRRPGTLTVDEWLTLASKT